MGPWSKRSWSGPWSWSEICDLDHDPVPWSMVLIWDILVICHDPDLRISNILKILSWYHNPRSASHRSKTSGDTDNRIMIHDHDPSHVNSYDPWSWSWKLVWWGSLIMILIWPLCQIGSWSSKIHGHDPEPPWVPTCEFLCRITSEFCTKLPQYFFFV